MNAARQISRRFDRATGTRRRFAVDYSIIATLSVVPDPLETHLAYDKKDRQTEDSEQMLKIVLAVLKDKIGVELSNLCRPSESTLLFHSDMAEKDVFDVFARCLSDKLYYSLSRIVPTSKTDGFIMQPKNSLTETLAKAWEALDDNA